MYLMRTVTKYKSNQLVEYKNTLFHQGFSAFVQSLERSKLLNEDSKCLHTNGLYSLTSEKITITFEKHPVMCSVVDMKVYASPVFQKMVETCMTTNGVLTEGKTTSEVAVTVQYHDELNPSVWTSEKIIRSDVRKALLKIADTYETALELPKLKIIDIVITGSSANYNWTKFSDIDLHLVVDTPATEKEYGSITAKYFEVMQKLWNEQHDITINDTSVEIYVQDKDEEHHSTGIYSLLNNEWIVEPKHQEPSDDCALVIKKVNQYKKKIDELTTTCTKATDVEKTWEQIKKMRKAGLEKAGERATENLVFKTLRNIGYIEKLATCKDKTFDRALSIPDSDWK